MSRRKRVLHLVEREKTCTIRCDEQEKQELRVNSGILFTSQACFPPWVVPLVCKWRQCKVWCLWRLSVGLRIDCHFCSWNWTADLFCLFTMDGAWHKWIILCTSATLSNLLKHVFFSLPAPPQACLQRKKPRQHFIVLVPPTLTLPFKCLSN